MRCGCRAAWSDLVSDVTSAFLFTFLFTFESLRRAGDFEEFITADTGYNACVYPQRREVQDEPPEPGKSCALSTASGRGHAAQAGVNLAATLVPDAPVVGAVLAVDRCGGMNQAARQLGVSQQAISRRIAQAERQLGVTLFRRTPQGSQATEEGRSVVQTLAELDAAMQRCDAALAQVRDEQPVRPLTLAVSHTIAELDYPLWVSGFRRRRPDCSLSMRQLNSQDAQHAVLEGAVELAVIESHTVAHQLASTVVGHDRLVVVVPAGHPWASRAGSAAKLQVTKQEVLATPLVLREPGSGTRQVVEDALGDSVIAAGEFGSLASQRTAIGVLGQPGVIARRAVHAQLASGEYVEVTVPGVDFGRQLRVVWDSANRPSEQAQGFIDYLARGGIASTR